MASKQLSHKHTLARQLLTSGFSLYIIVAIIATAIHLYIEYRNPKAQVQYKLEIIAQTYSPSLAQSL